MDKQITTWLQKALKDFFMEWPLKPEVETDETEQSLTLRIRTGKDALFTQPTAQPLLALQHLVRLMLRKQFPDYPKKLLVDIGNFREQQIEALNKAVQEAVWQAKASGNAVHLSPMSSFERRLVHMRIAEEPELVSESLGMGPDRHVVIRLSAK